MSVKNSNTAYQISDELWERIEAMLPPELPKNRGGLRIDNRGAMEATLYVFRAGCEWEEIPQNLGTPRAIRQRFQEWQESGVFQQMWIAGILTYDELRTMIWYGEPKMNGEKGDRNEI